MSAREAGSSAAPGRAAFAFIFITVLLDMLALGIIIPVLPSLILGFMGGDTAGSAEMLGLFGTAWALMQFLFSPLLGALSDRFGRRPVILMSCLGLGLDWLVAHPQRLASVTPEQVAAAALEFFAPANFTGVLVGDAEQLKPKLSALGGVSFE